jgi:hypothetical protein
MSSLVRGAILLVFALATAAPAGATGEWLPPQDVSPTPGVVETPSVATDALGTVFAVWASDEGVLSAARPAAGGAWEHPQPLSAPGATGPRIAVTPAGTAIAVWLLSDLVQAAVRPPGGAWGPAEPISSPLDSSQAPPGLRRRRRQRVRGLGPREERGDVDPGGDPAGRDGRLGRAGERHPPARL